MTTVLGLAIVALAWSLAGLARGDVEAALTAWALPAATLAALAWERWKEPERCE